MGAVQLVGHMGDQFGQPLGRGGRLDVAQLDQALDLARADAVQQRPLLAAGLGDPDLVEGGLAGDRARAVVVRASPRPGRPAACRRRCGSTRRRRAAAETRMSISSASWPIRAGLGRLRARGVAVDGRGARDLEVQALDLLQQAVGLVDRALDAGCRRPRAPPGSACRCGRPRRTGPGSGTGRPGGAARRVGSSALAAKAEKTLSTWEKKPLSPPGSPNSDWMRSYSS